jgi:RimJ/RimL family protein N-acetyltransferase/methionyl-tRNA formyltransferase
MILFPKDTNHVMLFGGSPLLLKLAKMLREMEYEIDIFTSPRQEAEFMGDGRTLGQALTKSGMDWYVVTDDINQTLPLQSIGPTTLGIGLGEAWQFKAPILDAFQGRLLDFMGIPLPRYRGGAHYTWAILNQELEWGCCLQEVTSNTVQGECDDGAVVFRKCYDIPYLTVPKDWFEECGKYEIDFLKSFFQQVKAGKAFDPVMPDERKSLFLPRLKTTEHGWIDWTWKGSDIADFINAFDEPYPGAHTTLDGKVVQLRGGEFFDTDDLHPFAVGLILRIEKNHIVVATKGGCLHVDVVEGVEGMSCGQRFFTSRERLERALTYVPNYTPKGDQQAKDDYRIEGKKVTLRTLTLADCNERYLDWLNDPDVNRYLETRFQIQTQETIRAYAKAMESSANDYLFAIEENEGGTHIGNCKIGAINWHHRNADISYFIGQKGLWGKGLATEAIRLATDFAIKKLGLYHIRAGAYEANIGSIKALRKAGYAFDGIWNGQLLDGDKRTGHAWLSTTADAWDAVTI